MHADKRRKRSTRARFRALLGGCCGDGEEPVDNLSIIKQTQAQAQAQLLQLQDRQLSPAAPGPDPALRELENQSNNALASPVKQNKRFSALTPVKETAELAIGSAAKDHSPHSEKDMWAYYTKGKKLGTGTFANVYVVSSNDDPNGKQYALKVIHKKRLRGKEAVIRREIEVLRKVANHPHIVGLVVGDHSFFETANDFYLITELCEGGELFDAIVNRGFYSERDAAEVIAQILDALVYCHDLNVVHRDLKPENLLLKDNSSHSRVMVSDFGLSRLADSDAQLFQTMCGTPGYVAPEVILGKGHGKPCDLWSLGCITYVMLCGYIPFWGEDQAGLFDEIAKVNYTFDAEYWEETSETAKDFIRKLLLANPEERMTAKQAMEHPWIASVTHNPTLALVSVPMLEPKNLASTLQRGKSRHTAGTGKMGRLIAAPNGTSRHRANSTTNEERQEMVIPTELDNALVTREFATFPRRLDETKSYGNAGEMFEPTRKLIQPNYVE